MPTCVEVSRSHSHRADVPAKQTVAYTQPLHGEALAIEQTLCGDVDAFNELVLKYQQLAFSVAFRILQSRDMAEDVVQDSFLKAFCALSSFRGGLFKSWLMRIVVNNCYDIQRRHRHLNHVVLCDEDECKVASDCSFQPTHPQESPQAFMERMELSAQIEQGIRNLSSEQRTVVVLCDIHGCSYEETSEITGFSMGTVKSRLSRARARLRDILSSRPDLLPVGTYDLKREFKQESLE